MKNVWKVDFEAKYTGLGAYQPESVKVLANGDGEEAIRKAKSRVVGSTFEDGPIGGKFVKRKCRWVRLVGLKLLESIDV